MLQSVLFAGGSLLGLVGVGVETTPRQGNELRGGYGRVEAFWKCWCPGGGCAPLPAGFVLGWGGSSLAGLGELVKAFSCFAEVARVGPGHQGWPWTWPPACSPARLPLLALAALPERT